MARQFSQAPDYITATNAAFTSFPVSLSCWVFLTPGINADQSIFGFDHPGVDSGSFHINYRGDQATKAYYITEDKVGAGAFQVNTGRNETTGAWSNLVWTADASSPSVWNFYVNGSLLIGPVSQAAYQTVTEVIIGGNRQNSNGGSPSELLNGSVADCAFWNVVLTAAEALALANGARPINIRTASLKGWWPLTGIQSPEPDYSGANNDGTITGTANASGPPVMQFTPRWPQANLVAAATFNPAWALGRNQFIEGFAS